MLSGCFEQEELIWAESSGHKPQNNKNITNEPWFTSDYLPPSPGINYITFKGFERIFVRNEQKWHTVNPVLSIKHGGKE